MHNSRIPLLVEHPSHLGRDDFASGSGKSAKLILVICIGVLGTVGVAAILLLLYGTATAVFGGSAVFILTGLSLIYFLSPMDKTTTYKDVDDIAILRHLLDFADTPQILSNISGGVLATNNAFMQSFKLQILSVSDLVAGDYARYRYRKLLRTTVRGTSVSDSFLLAGSSSTYIELAGQRFGQHIIWSFSPDKKMHPLASEIEVMKKWGKPLLTRMNRGLIIEDHDGYVVYMNEILRSWIGLQAVPKDYKFPVNTGHGHMLSTRGEKFDIYVVDIPIPNIDNNEVCGTYRFMRKYDRQKIQEPTTNKGPYELDPLLYAAPLGVVMVDAKMNIASSNAYIDRMMDHDTLVVGAPVISLVSVDDQQTLLGLVKQAFKGNPSRIKHSLRLSGNGEKTVEVYCSFLKRTKNPCVILYLVNTTEEKRLEQQFVQAQKMQAVGQLAGGVAHDFNNLLTAIIGFCDLLMLRHVAGDQSFSDIMQIKQNANRAANLVRQLLAFSRQQTLRPKVLTVTDVLADLSHLLRRLIGENIDLSVHHGRNLLPIKVDQGQLEQVITNLAVNARDAMKDGGKLTIRTQMLAPTDPLVMKSEELDPDDYILIEVEDTGTGIDEEHLEKIFEPFFTTKEVGQGTGLGLATVYGIVKQTGGFVFVKSQMGKGTCFQILLRAYHSTGESEDLDKKEPVIERDLTGQGSILLVEDEDPVRMFATRALSNKGYTVHAADSGEAGLAIIQEKQDEIDLIITDVVMPVMDGPTLVRRARVILPTVPVIFVSGYAEDVVRKDLEADDVHFLAKPFSLKDLSERVKEIFVKQ